MGEKISEMQSKLLEMFKWFHSFCEEHQLRYYVLGGTMLGAVRHNGFIPWDDDIDVGMPREDYNRFIQLCVETQNERYIVEAPTDNNPEYQYLFAKVYDSKTTLIENLRKPILRGIYIDVFPLDGIGNTKKEATKNYSKLSWRINLEMMIVCAIRKERVWYKNLAVIFGHLISPLFVSERKLNKAITRLAESRSFDTEKYIGNFFGAWGIKEIMPREYFGKPTKYSFEGMQVYGPELADMYLKSLYNNYMELPPEEKRISHHDYLKIDLRNSYLGEGKEQQQIS